jgi:UDP-N-acetylglucosamine 4-epimerase
MPTQNNILVTGGAGFIGSHIVDALLVREDVGLVRVLDNLATGRHDNLPQHPRLEFMEGDIRDFEACRRAMQDIHLVTHQAALGSVPRSIQDPLTTNDVNITGTLHIFNAAREAGIQRVVYAASSSTYGDSPYLPKREDVTGKPLSPYAVTKLVNELYAQTFARIYDIRFVGLRYFNIFGPRQNPEGPYAAVIPLFIKSLLNHTPPTINGDGQHSRDFTYVANAVQANLHALFTQRPDALNEVYNIAAGERTTLLQLFDFLQDICGTSLTPVFGPERSGDVRHSLADISKAMNYLGYRPGVHIREGLELTVDGGRGTGDGGRGTGDGGRGTGDGGRGTVDGGRWTGDGGRGTVDGGRGTGDGGR